MTEKQQQPGILPWVQFRENMLTARETHLKAGIDAVRRFVDVHPVVSRLPWVKAVIDAQASKDQAKTFATLRTAAGHMQMIADPLAEAIVKQFPDKFSS